ncbi:hypothetical protein D9M72_523870 [compost metagenome]
MVADRRQEGEEGACLDDAGAECVDDRDGAGAKRLDDAGCADMRGLVELEGICKGGIKAAPEHAHRLEACDGSHHHPAAQDRQVFTFKQHEAQVAGDIGVFEIGLVGDAGRKHGDAVIRMQLAALKRVSELTEEARQSVDMGFGVEIGEGARGRDPVLQCEAGAGGRFRAIRKHPPIAVGAAADLEGYEMQEMTIGRLHADERPQELRV